MTPQHKASPSRKVVSRQLAREPRIESESMRDFADFIRSTGPSPGQEKPVQPFVNISGSGLKNSNASTSSLGRRVSTKQPTMRNSEGPSAKPRQNMEPRSPAGLTSGNDELIDFIRQGPPNTNNGQPRIPRNVAPFRTTVDSDQFDHMLGNHGNVESAFGSTSSTLDSKHSTQTVNSRTGLIPAPKVVQPAYSNTPQNLSGSMASNEPIITKTRRRIKDPYAIDSSDDDDLDDLDEDDEVEDQLTALPYSSTNQPQPQPPPAPAQKPQRQEKQESLMDFLNGMDPPSTSKPQPFMLSQETIAAARARAAASNSSLSSANTAVLRNGNGIGNGNGMGNGGVSSSYGAVSSTSLGGSDGASSSPAAATRNYNKPRLAARAPAISGPGGDGGRSGGASGGGIGAGGKTATSDLADFLRNSGPPEPPVRKDDEGGGGKKGSRKFWRSRKTYGDLP